MKKITEIFKILSDENRLRILLMLKQRSLCVCEITEALGAAFSTVSAHLKLMKSLGVVVDTREGRWITYSLSKDNNFLNKLLDYVERNTFQEPVIARDRAFISKTTRELSAAKTRKR
jgi:ArsR family transcriptional regulator